MRPDDIVLQVRQRGEWEAIDAGFALVRQQWLTLFPAWLLFLLAFSLCCLLLIPQDQIWLAPLLLWWLKPLFDRIILHILSHSLFKQQLNSADVFSAIPGLIRRTGLFGALTWRRSSLSRSYNLPIWQLEQLRGKAKRGRQTLLYLQGHSASIGLTISCALLQFTVILSVYGLILLLDPTGYVWEHMTSLFRNNGHSEYAYWLSVGDYCIQMLAIALIEPFYVAGGFALYLNRRTQLEAWDIEMAFRSLGERLTKVGQQSAKATGLAFACLALLVASLFGLSQPVRADAASNNSSNTEYLHPKRLPQSALPTQLEQVMQAEELKNRQQVRIWQPKDKTNTDKPDRTLSTELIQLLASVLRFIIWALALLGVLLLIVYRKRLLAMLRPTPVAKQTVNHPDVLFGMDIRPESLPEDIATTAQTLWQQQKPREALSLLYRGTLAQLTRQDQLAIADSHTEGDILTLAAGSLTVSRYQYLQQLTRQWQSIAYAHRIPPSAQVEPLFSGWQAFRNPPANETSDTTAAAVTATDPGLKP